MSCLLVLSLIFLVCGQLASHGGQEPPCFSSVSLVCFPILLTISSMPLSYFPTSPACGTCSSLLYVTLSFISGTPTFVDCCASRLFFFFTHCVWCLMTGVLGGGLSLLGGGLSVKLVLPCVVSGGCVAYTLPRVLVATIPRVLAVWWPHTPGCWWPHSPGCWLC